MRKKSISTMLVILALISTWYICQTVIMPNVDARIEHVNKILSGQQEPPYQYRLLTPLMGRIVESAVSTLIYDQRWQHVISYTFISFFTFLCIFTAFYTYLRGEFSENASIIGVILLQVVIPLSITGYYMEGDFITVLLYILGLFIIQQGKDIYLPVLIGLGTLNREQFIFILVWYFAHLIARRKITISKILLITTCLLVWFVVFVGIRNYFGFRQSSYTFALHMANNTNISRLFMSIIPLWISNVVGFVVLSILAFRKSDKFYQLSFLSLVVYTSFFFFNGNMWELAKFLPAYLIMIPMGLQVITGEFIKDINIQSERPARGLLDI